MQLQISEYEKQAADFLTKHNLEFRAVLVGDDCPRFCVDMEADRDMDKLNTFPRGTHIHGKHYRITISGKDRGHFTLDYWNSYHDEERKWTLRNRYRYHAPHSLTEKHKGVGIPQVTAYNVLTCITKYDPGTFEDFCTDFGYDSDSRKAERTYEAVVKEWRKVQRFFTADEIAELQEVQ